jgi:hypothetical protein
MGHKNASQFLNDPSANRIVLYPPPARLPDPKH